MHVHPMASVIADNHANAKSDLLLLPAAFAALWNAYSGWVPTGHGIIQALIRLASESVVATLVPSVWLLLRQLLVHRWMLPALQQVCE